MEVPDCVYSPTKAPCYRSNQRVYALKIKSIDRASDGRILLHFEEEGFNVDMTREIGTIAVKMPRPGMYLVFYGDGVYDFLDHNEFEVCFSLDTDAPKESF